jgi:hypothetical protein
VEIGVKAYVAPKRELQSFSSNVHRQRTSSTSHFSPLTFHFSL